MATKPLAVTYLDPLKLKPNRRNSRLHSSAQVARVRASLDEFGWTNPILTDGKLGVLAGHARLQAALLSPVQKAVPTIPLGSLTPAQKRAYLIADNKLALDADWDYDVLGEEMRGLMGEGVDLGLTGFSDEEVQSILNGWQTDFTAPESDSGSDPSVGKIVIEVEPSDVTKAKQKIKTALASNGIEFSFK
jgi:ParB-like chromosome segregation protein Spo0J